MRERERGRERERKREREKEGEREREGMKEGGGRDNQNITNIRLEYLKSSFI